MINARLNFTVNGTIDLATDEQITKAFSAVRKHAPGLPPESYKNIKGNNISADTNRLNGVFKARLARARSIAITWYEQDVNTDDLYPSFDSLPEDIQFAIVDMAYNMGSNEDKALGLAKFKLFRKALHEGDWPTAAKESYRPDCKRGSARNRKIYDWIYQYSGEMLRRAFDDGSLT